MIGGADIVLPFAYRDLALDAGFAALKRAWPECVIEDAEGERVYQGLAEAVDSEHDEFLVYKSETAQRMWIEEGAVRESENTMVHVIWSDGELTLVVDDPEVPQLQDFLGGLAKLSCDRIPIYIHEGIR